VRRRRSFLDPLSYVAPVFATTGTTAGKTINERSLNLALYQDIEDSVLDLDSAVRNGYLQRRQRDIEQCREEIRRMFEWPDPRFRRPAVRSGRPRVPDR